MEGGDAKEVSFDRLIEEWCGRRRSNDGRVVDIGLVDRLIAEGCGRWCDSGVYGSVVDKGSRDRGLEHPTKSSESSSKVGSSKSRSAGSRRFGGCCCCCDIGG